MSSITIVDYKTGNIKSVERAFRHVGVSVTLSSDLEHIAKAERLVLPGVGAFSKCVQDLQSFDGLSEALKMAVQRGVPVLGICVGMQMLFDESEEFGNSTGLSIIKGRVKKIPSKTSAGGKQKIPHIGWSELKVNDKHQGHDLLVDLKADDAMYFVHSYTAWPEDESVRVADCDYGGNRISAIVQQDNVFGMQFHPEKSGEVGLKILRRFVAL